MDRIELLRPADWHLHVRQGEAMRAVVPASAAVFAQALVMPNLKPPVTTTAALIGRELGPLGMDEFVNKQRYYVAD